MTTWRKVGCCLAVAAGVLFTASAEGLPGAWVKISFRKTEMKSQIQLSEIGVYDADGKRLNLGMTKVDVGTDPASLAEKQFVTSANALGQNKDMPSNCFDNNLGTKWYQDVPGMDETTTSTWRTVTMRLEYNAQPLGYNFATKNSAVENLRVFVNAHNLCTFSSLRKNYNLDPENISGLYPLIKSVNAGVTITF